MLEAGDSQLEAQQQVLEAAQGQVLNSCTPILPGQGLQGPPCPFNLWCPASHHLPFPTLGQSGSCRDPGSGLTASPQLQLGL